MRNQVGSRTPSGIQSMQGRIEKWSIGWQTQEKGFSFERVPM